MIVGRELELKLTPVDVLRALRGRRRPFMLSGDWGCGTMLGCDPTELVRGAETFDVSGGGWWVGYLGYQLGATVERLPPPPPRPVPLEPGQLTRDEWVLRQPPADSPAASHVPGRLPTVSSDDRWLIEAISDEALERGCSLLAGLLPPAGQPPVHQEWRLGPLSARGGDDVHRAAVAECTRRIAAGEIFQANICLRLEGEFTGSTADAFAEACEQLRPAHGAYIGLDDGAILSFSPELFLKRSGQAVLTAPIKGTAPRAESAGHREAAAGSAAVETVAAPDAARAGLVASAKDAAEHVMIVDLMRNDLGRVCEYGTVSAARDPAVEAHPGVWHLVTGVEGRLRAEVTNGQLLRATFPPGSVTGAPKVQAMKLIGELEGSAREAYTGAIGYIGPGGDELELNVVIRTLEVHAGRAWLGAGGGIVADSDPDAELAEAYTKAAPILRALRTSPPAMTASGRVPRWGATLSRRQNPEQGIFETVLVRAGAAVDLERHLERLQNSARQLFGLTLRRNLAAEVQQAAATAAEVGLSAAAAETGRPAAAAERDQMQSAAHDAVMQPHKPVMRLRVHLRPDGATEVTLAPANVHGGPITLTPITVTGGLGPHKLADRAPLGEFERPGHAGLICDADGTVLEATFANIWALIGGRLLTPPADGRLLPGTVRRRLLEAGQADGIEFVSETFTLNELHQAQGLITTSSIRLAAPACLSGEAATVEAERLAATLTELLSRTE